ncbi:hypothetical protein [Microbacterium sp. JZ31]|uniref:hypothetical protein n=1 Tax=Microbacterium sp. JZ31 TaxID=1906274 RepID=UPI0019319F52|nr:hypothetical protein [Microbacterium sp. JZ31]
MLLLVILLGAIGLLSSAAIVATVRAVARDGYRAVRTDALRIPDLRASSESRIP